MLLGLLRAMRPKQWAKNVLVFVAPAAAGVLTEADYLFSTAAHLHALGIPDPDLDQLAERVRALRE